MNGQNPGCPKLFGEKINLKINKNMKKLNLGKLKLLEDDVLDRNQLAHIHGGEMSQMSCNLWSCNTGWGCYESNCCCSTGGCGSTGICVSTIGGQCP